MRAAEQSHPGRISPVQRDDVAPRRAASSRARLDVVGGRAGPQFRSEGYREVISAPPPYLVRSGSIITAIAFLTLAIVAWIVPYPSIVGGRAHIVSAQLPVTLLSRGNGKLALLAAKEGDLVSRDDILAIIDDGSDVRAMLDLERWLGNVPADLSDAQMLPAVPAVALGKLGAAQAPLLVVIQSLTNLTAFRASSDTADQVTQLRQVVATHKQLVDQFRDKENAAEASLKADQRMQAGRQTLIANGFATNAYLDKFEAGRQAQRDRLAESRIATARNLTTIATTEREISALLAARRDRDTEMAARLAGALRDLRGVMQEWERVDVIRAPQAGRIRLFGLWSEAQNLKAGDTFAVVEPADTTPTAFAFVPAAGFGKVQLGQRVTIRLDAYPRTEFGLLEARVAATSAVAIDGKYRILLDLPKALQLTGGRTVQFTQNMDGDARIEVNSLRLIQQIFNHLLAVIE